MIVEGYCDIEPLAGGFAAETFTGTREATGERVVLRVFGVGNRRRGPEAPGLQAAVMALVRGLVPVPDVVEVRAGLLVTTLLPGRQLSVVLPEVADPRPLGTAVGDVLGRMTNMATLGAGCYLDDKLSYGPWEPGSESLHTWLDLLCQRAAASAWTSTDLAALRRLAERGDELLAHHHRAVNTHGDFSARNVLVDGERVSGVIDWEFAHRGHPLEDLGRLLRVGSGGAFVDAVIDAFTRWLPAAEQADREVIRERARAADFYWLLENGTQEVSSPAVTKAAGLVAAMARSGSFLPDLAASASADRRTGGRTRG